MSTKKGIGLALISWPLYVIFAFTVHEVGWPVAATLWLGGLLAIAVSFLAIRLLIADDTEN